MKHKSCGRIFEQKPVYHLQNNGCPRCKESKGEKRISRYLEQNQIKYEPQYRIDDCRNILPLPFDFAIFENGVLKGLIEFQGEQHFKPRMFIRLMDEEKGLEHFQIQIKKDKIKKEYCQENSIPLLEFSYEDEERIEEILEQFLNEVNV
jgi:hypothetical protein